MADNDVLVFPQDVFDAAFSLLLWDNIKAEIDAIEDAFDWMDRSEAEHSAIVAQAIPCTVIRNRQGDFCVLRRVRNQRKDLDGRLSLIVGGHIDRKESASSFMSVVASCLMREIDEEVGFCPEHPPEPIGVIVDRSSPQATRHVAFLHQTEAEHVTPLAEEEFAPYSKFHGAFLHPSEIADRHREFDPWSQVVIAHLTNLLQPPLL